MCAASAKPQLAVISKNAAPDHSVLAEKSRAAGVHGLHHAILHRVAATRQHHSPMLSHVGGVTEPQPTDPNVVPVRPEYFLSHRSLDVRLIGVTAANIP